MYLEGVNRFSPKDTHNIKEKLYVKVQYINTTFWQLVKYTKSCSKTIVT